MIAFVAFTTFTCGYLTRRTRLGQLPAIFFRGRRGAGQARGQAYREGGQPVISGGWRGPGWRVVDAGPGQGKQVRDWIRSAITRHHCPVDPADAALAAGELYANAVMHGPAGGRVLAGYCLWSAGARIVVCDGGGTGTPRLRQGTGLAEGGRGLQVVDAVAARWGSFRLALTGTRVVWCDFGQPLRVPAGDAWAWLRPVLAVCVLSAPAAPGAGIWPGHPLVPGAVCRAAAAAGQATAPGAS
jgi:anti-sigma regulatory factor (Ser/Thr protein kinase)